MGVVIHLLPLDFYTAGSMGLFQGWSKAAPLGHLGPHLLVGLHGHHTAWPNPSRLTSFSSSVVYICIYPIVFVSLKNPEYIELYTTFPHSELLKFLEVLYLHSLFNHDFINLNFSLWSVQLNIYQLTEVSKTVKIKTFDFVNFL